MSNEGALRLTIARYYTPSGRSIQRTYEDLDSYYTDYEERYYSGEFFSKDSIAKGNSDLFETMELKRPVFGGGGITPDIFVPIDSILFDPFYGEVVNEIPQYVFRKIANDNLLMDEEKIDESAQKIFEAFVQSKLTEENEEEW